jgi:site-specific recombinase XerD
MSTKKSTSKKVRGVFEKVRGSGIWWIQYFDAEGRRRREKAGRRSDALTLLNKRKTEKLQRKKLPENLRAKAVTFGQLSNDAIEHSKVENGERSTLELQMKYETLKPIFGSRSAEGITKQEIVRWLTATAAKRNWEPATKNRWQAAFSLAFRVGIENDKIDKNPASRIGRTKEDNGRVRWLSDTEEPQLRNAISKRTPQHVPAFDLSLNTGMRSGEQFSLRWSQIDADRCSLFLPKTKNGKSRHIPLNAVAMEALQILKQQHEEVNPHSPWVFLNENGEKLRGHRDWFEPALLDSGVPDYSWHCNRHTFASRLVMAGVDLRTVGELLGHRDPKMTWRYSHLAPSHQQRAVDRLVPAGRLTRTKTESQSATRSATGSVVVLNAAAV